MTEIEHQTMSGVVPDTLASPFPFVSIEDRLAAGEDAAWLYRYFDAAGALLYIGVSKHPAIRDEQHWMAQSDWRGRAVLLRLDLFPRRADASRAESIAIVTETPVGNRQRFPLSGSDRNAVCAPDGNRTLWATVSNYSRWWTAPVLMAAGGAA